MRAEVRTLIAAKFDTRSSADLATAAEHVDMRIRQKAQFELVRRGDVQTLLAAAKDPANQQARIHGVWGIAQMARTGADGAKHAALLTPLLTDSDAEIRAQAAKMLGDLRYAPAASNLIPLLADSAPRPRFFAAEALGRIAYKPAVPQIVSDARRQRRQGRAPASRAAALRSRESATQPRSARSRLTPRAACASPPSSRCGA